MKSVIDILEHLESNNSRLFKEDVLEKNANNLLLKRIFVAAFDPYLDYGVRKFKKQKSTDASVNDDIAIDVFLRLLDRLATRELTGNAAKDAVSHNYHSMNALQQKWCERILLKNLRCGVQSTTVNKTWPDLIRGFEVQLAKTLKTTHDRQSGISIVDIVKYPVRVEPKLDGLRLIAIKQNNVVTMYTRNGTVLNTLPTITKALEKAKFDNVVFDGEALAKSGDWNSSVSVLMSRKDFKDDADIVYHVFDVLPLSEWVSQTTETPLNERVLNVVAKVTAVNDSCVTAVKGSVVHAEAELLSFYAESMNTGNEGIMLKDLEAPYAFKRSDAILKMKPTVTFEGAIVGHYDGRDGTKHEGKFGGFYVVLPNGVVTRIGGGFNDKDRAQFQLEGLESFTGKIVEIEGQPDPMTKDGLTLDGRIRFPVFLRFRDSSDVDQKIIEAYENYMQQGVAND